MSEAARRMRSVSAPDPEADPDAGDVRATLAAELESGEPVEAVPVIPSGHMDGFRARWRKSPRLRSLIRAAGRLDEAQAMRSRVGRALWEMSRSREWKADGRGLLNDCPEFAELFERGPP